MLSKYRAAPARFDTIDEAAEYAAFNLKIWDKAEIAKILLLARHHKRSSKDFAVAMAEVSPLKPDSIAINQSRFERLIDSKTDDYFIANFKMCLRAIDYNCSQESVKALVDKFFNRQDFVRDKKDQWFFDAYYDFCKNQPVSD